MARTLDLPRSLGSTPGYRPKYYIMKKLITFIVMCLLIAYVIDAWRAFYRTIDKPAIHKTNPSFNYTP